mgnify:CR=1 FL=1
MIAGFRNIRIEASKEYIEEWFDTTFVENLGDYLVEVGPSPHDKYDVQAETNVDAADLRYEVSESGPYTDVHVEASGGDLAVDSAIRAFDELWNDSEFPEKAQNS